MSKIHSLFLCLFALIITSCTSTTLDENQANTLPTQSGASPISADQTPAQPARLLSTPISNSAGVTIEENKIIGPIELDMLKFVPEHGTQEEVMDRHESEKQPCYQLNKIKTIDFSPALYPTNGGQAYKASTFLIGENETAQIWIRVEKDGMKILEEQVGYPTVTETLRGLWIDSDGSWVLEIAPGYLTGSGDDIRREVVGRLYQNGELLNEKYGYEEMFGYQLLDDKPFYFYKMDGLIRLSYDGQDLPINYDEIPHYGCCSSAVLNPVAAPNWVGFFGRRGDIWYYTEVGSYNPRH